MPSTKPDVLFMVPARSGSVGMPRKNLRMLAGHPLIAYSLLAIKEYGAIQNCYVITDGEEIADIARQYEAKVLMEPKTTGKATLDDVAVRMLGMMSGGVIRDDSVLLTVQPTCPFVTPDIIRRAVEAFSEGAGCVITCVDDRHLSWDIGADGVPVKAYKERLNRQFLPPHFRESGAVIAARVGSIKANGTRIVEPVRLIEVSRKEAIDIDTYEDFLLAEHLMGRKKIVLRADGGHRIGMGHVYRALAIAYELVGHEVVIVTKEKEGEDFVGRFLEDYPFRVVKIQHEEDFFKFLKEYQPRITMIDILDTEASYIKAVRETPTKIVSFEDLGPGAEHADIVINELYFHSDVRNELQLTGVRHAILAPSFDAEKPRCEIGKHVDRILVIYGGTDPEGLTAKALSALAAIGFNGHVDVVCGAGHKDVPDLGVFGLRGTVHRNVRHMPSIMKMADVALSSAGRTVTELMSLGIPTVVMCQNDKELTHTHANSAHGVLNLGLGGLIDPLTLQNHLQFVIESHKYRVHMNKLARAAIAGRSNRACLKLIGSMIGEEL